MEEKKDIYDSIKINCKLWLSTDDDRGIMGDGKWLLLKTIDERGSLKSAAEFLNISYRKAWGDLRKAEKILGFPLTIKTRGGESGGNSLLTEEGKKIILAYDKLHSDIHNYIDFAFDSFIKDLRK
ncbi:MAG: LysR family transcriptional regulator [Bacteroidales bacterium]|nr:LysR family transcriptional regulator [Bacteroidales bacterium]